MLCLLSDLGGVVLCLLSALGGVVFCLLSALGALVSLLLSALGALVLLPESFERLLSALDPLSDEPLLPLLFLSCEYASPTVTAISNDAIKTFILPPFVLLKLTRFYKVKS